MNEELRESINEEMNRISDEVSIIVPRSAKEYFFEPIDYLNLHLALTESEMVNGLCYLAKHLKTRNVARLPYSKKSNQTNKLTFFTGVKDCKEGEVGSDEFFSDFFAEAYVGSLPCPARNVVEVMGSKPFELLKHSEIFIRVIPEGYTDDRVISDEEYHEFNKKYYPQYSKFNEEHNQRDFDIKVKIGSREIARRQGVPKSLEDRLHVIPVSLPGYDYWRLF